MEWGYAFYRKLALLMGSKMEASYELPASCYAPCIIPFDKLSAQSTFQEPVGIVKSPNHLEMKVDKTSYN